MKRALIVLCFVVALAGCSSGDGSDLLASATSTVASASSVATTARTTATTLAAAPSTSGPTTPTTTSTTVAAAIAPLTMEAVDAYTMEPINRGVRTSFDFYELDNGMVTLAYSTNFGSSDHESIVAQRRVDAWDIAHFIAPYGVGLDLSIDDQRWVASPELMSLVAGKAITKADWITQTEQP